MIKGRLEASRQEISAVTPTSSPHRQAISTASGPASTTLTVTDYAPNPGSPGNVGGKSCVYVTDSRTSQTTSASYVSTDTLTGFSSWSYGLNLDQVTPEGTYQLSLA